MDSQDVGRMFDRDLEAATNRYNNQDDKIITFYGLTTKGVYAGFCCVGEAIGLGDDTTASRQSCGNLGCICTAEDDAFRIATPQEDAVFWEALHALTAQAIYEQEHDL